MADDGTKYAWDEEAQDWTEIEGNEEDELEEDQEEEDEVGSLCFLRVTCFVD